MLVPSTWYLGLVVPIRGVLCSSKYPVVGTESTRYLVAVAIRNLLKIIENLVPNLNKKIEKPGNLIPV